MGAHAVAVSGDVDDCRAVQKSVEHGCGDGGVGEDVTPGSNVAVRRQDDGAVEEALRHDLEQCLGASAGLGYVHLDQHSAELLFQILTEREERAAIAVAANAPFSEWSKTFTDPRLAAAVVDRITYRAHIIQTGTTSYRLNNRNVPARWGQISPRRPGANSDRRIHVAARGSTAHAR